MTKAYRQQEPSQDEVQDAFFYRDGELFWKNKITRKPIGAKAGSAEKDGYIRIRFMGRKIYAHRLIWIFHRGACPPLIDHIDKNKRNNRIENLRSASKSQNALNSELSPSRSATGARGVHASGRKYVARIVIGGRRLNLGSYESIETARLAYKAALESQWPEAGNPPT